MSEIQKLLYAAAAHNTTTIGTGPASGSASAAVRDVTGPTPIVWGELVPSLVVCGDVLTLCAVGLAMSSDAGLLAGALCFALLMTRRVHRLTNLRDRALQLSAIPVPVTAGGALLAGILLLQGQTPDSVALWTLVWICAAGGLLAAARLIAAPLIARRLADRTLATRVAIVGDLPFGWAVAGRLARSGPTRHVIGVFGEAAGSAATRSAGSLDDLIALSRKHRVDSVIVAVGAQQMDAATEICRRLGSMLAELRIAVALPGSETVRRVEHDDEVELPLTVTVRRRALSDWQYIQKSAFDRIVAGLLLLALAPLLAAVALAIRLDTPGPVLFRQPRVGFNNVRFSMFKFRSMHHHMSDMLADRQTTRGDARVTGVGRILRKLSLDELPQLINVLRGDMSLVGPRPHAPNTATGGRPLPDVVAEYAERHRVKPGITGWAQVNGSRGALVTEADVGRRVTLDLEYIANWSMRLDLKIMIMTALREIVSKQAC